MATLADVANAALELDPPTRQLLVEQLIASLEGCDGPELSAEWEAEISRRLADGSGTPRPGAQVFARARAAVDASTALSHR